MFKRKKIIEKLKMKKIDGNVSLLVILVLLASSLIALLSINQIQHLMTYGNMTFNYFRSYYLAKAGTELGLVEVYNRDSGFESQIQSGDALVIENLVGNYTEFNPYFIMNIDSNFRVLTDDIRFECKNGNRIVLLPGDGIVIPFFKDETQGTSRILNLVGGDLRGMDENDIKNIGFEDKSPDDVSLTFGFFIFDDRQNMSYIKVEQGQKLKDFLNHLSVYDGNQKYLTVKNPSDRVVEFCVAGGTNQEIPYSDAIVTVQANYADMEVGLQSVIKRQTPSWSMNVLGDINLSSL